MTPSAPDERIGGSIAAHLLAVQKGAAIVRVHDVAETVQALRVSAAIEGSAMSDRIFIKGLALHACHGVMAHEAKVGQTFTLDLDLEIDLSAAARSDKVADTVSYDKVVDCVSEAFCAQRYRLIEAAAGRVADAVLATFPPRPVCTGDDPQAARSHCRHLRRCRGDAGASSPWLRRCSRLAAMSEIAAPFSTAPSLCSAMASRYA